MPELFQMLEKMIITYGAINAFILIVLLGFLYFMFHRMKTKISEDIKKESAISIESVKGEINKEIELYKKQLDMPFLNEPIRTALITESVLKCNEARFEIFQEIYYLFFEVIYSISNIKKYDSEAELVFKSLFDKLTEARKNVFVKSVFAPRLTDFLLNAVIALRDDVSDKYNELQGQPKRLRHERQFDASDEIHKAEKWIIENLYTNMTPKGFDNSDNLKDIRKVED